MSAEAVEIERKRIEAFNKDKTFRIHWGKRDWGTYDYPKMLELTNMPWELFDHTFLRFEVVFTEGTLLVERVIDSL